VLAVTLKADALFSGISACCQMHNCIRSRRRKQSEHTPSAFFRCLPKTVGSMQLLFDETSELEEGRARRDALLSTESVKRGRRKTMIDSVSLRPTSAYS